MSSFYINFWLTSTVSWFSNSQTITTCTKFNYIFNDPTPSTYEDKKPVYIVYCPIDSPITLPSAQIQVLTPSSPIYFTENFNLGAVFSYSVSK